MRLPLSILLAVALIFISCSPTNKETLSFQSPAGWKAEQKTPGGLDFYTVTAGRPGEGLLMFSQWPAPSSTDEIPALVKKLADGFLAIARKSPELRLVSQEYRVEQFTGSQCQGNYVVFRTESGGTNEFQAMFMMSVGGTVWNGQFTGPSNAWIHAIELLKSIKKNG